MAALTANSKFQKVWRGVYIGSIGIGHLHAACMTRKTVVGHPPLEPCGGNIQRIPRGKIPLLTLPVPRNRRLIEPPAPVDQERLATNPRAQCVGNFDCLFDDHFVPCIAENLPMNDCLVSRIHRILERPGLKTDGAIRRDRRKLPGPVERRRLGHRMTFIPPGNLSMTGGACGRTDKLIGVGGSRRFGRCGSNPLLLNVFRPPPGGSQTPPDDDRHRTEHCECEANQPGGAGQLHESDSQASQRAFGASCSILPRTPHIRLPFPELLGVPHWTNCREPGDYSQRILRAKRVYGTIKP